MCFVIVRYALGYSWFRKAELGLGLSWGCSVPSVRLTHSDAMSVKLIHIQISSVRLTHSCAMGVKLIHIEITSGWSFGSVPLRVSRGEYTFLCVRFSQGALNRSVFS